MDPLKLQAIKNLLLSYSITESVFIEKVKLYVSQLEEYEGVDVSLAVRKAIRHYVEYPPSLGQLILLIEAERRNRVQNQMEKRMLEQRFEITQEEREINMRKVQEIIEFLAPKNVM